MPPGLETTLTLGLASLRGSLGEAVRERSGCASYAAGDVVVREGSPVAHVHVVQDGQLAATVAGQHGREVEVSRYGRGDVFGEMSFLSGSPASATVTARTDCRLVSIPHAVLGEAADGMPAIWTELGGLVAERLALINQRVRQDALGGELWVNWGPGLPHKAGLALARSCAFHLQRPVAVLQPRAIKRDATTSPGDAPGGGPWVSEVEVDGAADFVRAAREVATTHALVLVRAPRPEGVAARALDILEGHEPRNVTAEHVALVREARATPFELEAIGRDSGTDIVGAISRDQLAALDLGAALTAESSIVEPWRSIGRIARWVTHQRIGLALGAGVAKGYGHVGVLEELQRRSVAIDYVSGSSIGSAVAAGVASQQTPEFIRQSLDECFRRASRRRLPYSSFLSNKPLHRYLSEMLQEATFAQAAIPLSIIAVDADSHVEVTIREGFIADAIVASCAIPGIYPPVMMSGRRLIDGGLVNPVPITTVAAMGANLVIGVRLTGASRTRGARSHLRNLLGPPPIVDNVLGAIEIMMNKLSAESASRADVLIEPFFDTPTGIKDYRNSDQFVAAGRSAVASAHERLKERVPWIQ